MKKVVRIGGKSKKKPVLGEAAAPDEESLGKMDIDTKVEVIQALIPLGLMAISEMLQEEVKGLVGERYHHGEGNPGFARHGSNPSSVGLARTSHQLSAAAADMALSAALRSVGFQILR